MLSSTVYQGNRFASWKTRPSLRSASSSRLLPRQSARSAIRDLAARRLDEAGEDPQHRRLAAAGLADEGDELLLGGSRGRCPSAPASLRLDDVRLGDVAQLDLAPRPRRSARRRRLSPSRSMRPRSLDGASIVLADRAPGPLATRSTGVFSLHRASPLYSPGKRFLERPGPSRASPSAASPRVFLARCADGQDRAARAAAAAPAARRGSCCAARPPRGRPSSSAPGRR